MLPTSVSSRDWQKTAVNPASVCQTLKTRFRTRGPVLQPPPLPITLELLTWPAKTADLAKSAAHKQGKICNADRFRRKSLVQGEVRIERHPSPKKKHIYIYDYLNKATAPELSWCLWAEACLEWKWKHWSVVEIEFLHKILIRYSCW